ncbi:TPA: hypothetical protein EYP44_02720 [Candidatus Bathyarchaeota archaeon]|nr:hypothetical protein [Candidatus Bathyarchaeota archaeon]
MRKMTAFKCDGCGKISYPRHARCPSCKGRTFKEIELGDECVLTTYTRLYAVPQGVEQIPLVLGMVEFGSGVRALGQVTAEEVEIGMRLRPVWGPLRRVRGKTVYGFKFEPIKTA